MKIAVRVALILGVVIVLAFLLTVKCSSHGHMHELLEVTVRVVDRDSGKPLDGAVVTTLRSRNYMEGEYLESYLKAALDVSDERRWRSSVCASRTTASAKTIIRSSIYVTRYWTGPVETGKEIIIPRILLVDHPRHGRTIVPIDEDAPIEPGAEPNTWRLDLGTVRVP